MSFRTVEITGPAELHVKNGSLVVEKEIKENKVKTDQNSANKADQKKRKKPEITKLMIPLEDINTIVCMGAGIRISTMAMAQLCRNKISMTILDEKYRPSGFLNAYEANTRQSLTMRRQVFLKEERAENLWRKIVNRKIRNQARVLDILGLSDTAKLRSFASHTQDISEIDPLEAGAAKAYFAQLCPEMNRREETPMNSCLNSGLSNCSGFGRGAIRHADRFAAFGCSLSRHSPYTSKSNPCRLRASSTRPCFDLSVHGSLLTRKLRIFHTQKLYYPGSYYCWIASFIWYSSSESVQRLQPCR